MLVLFARATRQLADPGVPPGTCTRDALGARRVQAAPETPVRARRTSRPRCASCRCTARRSLPAPSVVGSSTRAPGRWRRRRRCRSTKWRRRSASMLHIDGDVAGRPHALRRARPGGSEWNRRHPSKTRPTTPRSTTGSTTPRMLLADGNRGVGHGGPARTAELLDDDGPQRWWR